MRLPLCAVPRENVGRLHILCFVVDTSSKYSSARLQLQNQLTFAAIAISRSEGDP